MRRIVTAVVAVGAIAAVAIWLVFGRDPGTGPFGGWQSDGGYDEVGIRARPGQTIATEYPLPKTLSVPVVLLGVRLMRAGDGRGMTLRYGARANEAILEMGRAGWKPRKWHVRPLAGFVIPAHHRGVLEIGMSSKQLGLHRIRGFILTYRIGGTTYSAPQQQGYNLDVRERAP